MKKLITLLAIASGLLLAGNANAQQQRQAQIDPASYFSKMLGREDVFNFRSAPSDIYGRFNNPAPVFVIYPDVRTSREEAEAFVKDSGIQAIIDEFSGSAYVVNPLGAKYDNAKDFEAYVKLIETLRMGFNLKVVGIGAGADFVNETIARKAGNLAGIVSIGGKAAKKAVAGESPVPAYICGKYAVKTGANFVNRDNAVLVSKDGKKQLYVNADEPLLRVAINPSISDDYKAIIADAWDQVLSWNYRFNNYDHTWYNGEKFLEHGDSELEPFLIFDRLGLTRNVVVEKKADGNYLWYEYMNDAVINAAPGTVPLVVLLHGNNNDPRTQAETSGFLPLAARDNFMVAEFEWQGNGYAAMGHDGIETVIYELFNKYPQIDRSRVYAEGLSAGAFTATALGIKKTHIFAAVGAQSGGFMAGGSKFGANGNSVVDEATLKSEGCDMPYFSISGIADDIVAFPKKDEKFPSSIEGAWQIYSIINNLPFEGKLDFDLDPVFGMKLKDRRHENTVKNISYEIGDLCNAAGVPLVRIVGVNNYAHWNFQPGAELMWQYFQLFSRDPKSKKLIYHGE